MPNTACQTDDSELISSSGMMERFRALCQELQAAREELDNARIGIQIEHEERLETKISELYADVNCQITEQQRSHDSRLTTVRGSFQQQMRDALAQQAGLYKEEIRRIKQSITEHNERESAVLKRHIEEQVALLQRKEIIVEKLKERIKHQEAELALHQVEVASLERALGDCIDVLRKSDALTRVLHALDRESVKKEDMVAELTRRVAASNRRVAMLESENVDVLRQYAESKAELEDTIKELIHAKRLMSKSRSGSTPGPRQPSPTTIPIPRRRERRGSVAGVMGGSRRQTVLSADHVRRAKQGILHGLVDAL